MTVPLDSGLESTSVLRSFRYYSSYRGKEVVRFGDFQ
jgi:hypothetical protein